MYRFSGVAASHVGLVRSGNEDSGFLGARCMLVADGVGGAAAGEVASATAAHAVSTLAEQFSADDPVTVLRAGVLLAQQQVAAGAQRNPARSGMATTLTAVATDGVSFAIAHVGDSRGYVFRDGSLTRVTHDHTYVQRLVDDGDLPESAVARHPWRHVVLRCVNGSDEEGGDVTRLALRPGDRVLLASDGLTDLVSEPVIEQVLARDHDDAAVQSLVDTALVNGGRDNITCLLASVVEGPEVQVDPALVGAVRDRANVLEDAAVRMPHSA